MELKEDEEVGMAEKKRVYWKDLIKREEDRLVKMQEEAEAEKLKFGDKDGDDDKKVKEIGSVNPIADFRNIVKDKKVDRVAEGINLMQKMIERIINVSLKGDLFGKAIDCLKELRNACVDEDEAPKFNRFAQKIRN